MVYYYIDESGGISNNSNLFILGCIKTFSPESLEKELNLLNQEIRSSLYFYPLKNKFEEQGFHATENHPDIKAKLYSILPLLDYRAYFVILNKSDNFYHKLKETHDDEQIYKYCLDNLLADRLISNKFPSINMIFEEIILGRKSTKKIIEECISNILPNSLNINIKLENKSNAVLALVDYLNYIFHSILSDSSNKTQERMRFNFDLVKPKIGSIKILNNSYYFSRRKEFSLDDLKNQYNG